MKRVNFGQAAAYVGAAVLAVGGAFLISTRFVHPAKAQAPGAPNAMVPVPPPPGANQPVNPNAPASAPNAAPPGGNGAALPGGAPPVDDPMSNSGIAELEGFLEPFIYDIVNRRDPFQAFAEFVQPEDTGPQRALSPAQRWDLEQLKLIGIMWDIKDPKAMFLDPEEEVMILGRDESIGNRNGYIAAIREGEVVVVEAIRKRGDIIYRTRVLRIER